MKITNIKSNISDQILTEYKSGWKIETIPYSTHATIKKLLKPGQGYWWAGVGKDTSGVAVIDVTNDQATELTEAGYKFDVVKESEEVKNMKITNIREKHDQKILRVAENDSYGWEADKEDGLWLIEKMLEPEVYYTWDIVHDKPVVIEVTKEEAKELLDNGWEFDEVEENEGMKFYALQDKFGLVFQLPADYHNGFRAGKVFTRPIEKGIGYLIFTKLEEAQEIADYSYPAGGLDKLQVVEIDPIAKKVIKVIEEPKPTKWRVAWSGGEPTPKWFKGDMVTGWSLITSKPDATVFDTLKEAENVVEYLSLTGLYVTEDK